MRVWLLGSGSAGNACLVEGGDTRVLVDAGFGVRELAARLAAIGVAPASICAVVVSHEHHDHARGACRAAAKWGWALHASAGTIRACPELADAGARAFTAGATIELEGLSLATVSVPHDAEEQVAFIATARGSGARAAICTDFGAATDDLRGALRDIDVLVLEANHDEGMLRAGPYPPSVRHRIGGRYGHLSNRAAGVLARDAVHPALQHLVLAHLSEQCNDAAIALRTVSDALVRTRFRGSVSVASQSLPVGPFAPRVGRHREPGQLSFGF